jgi:pseudouridine-5'-phosphate glycosidase
MPFLLSQMKEITAGKSLQTNRALLVNNVSIVAQIVVSLSRIS